MKAVRHKVATKSPKRLATRRLLWRDWRPADYCGGIGDPPMSVVGTADFSHKTWLIRQEVWRKFSQMIYIAKNVPCLPAGRRKLWPQLWEMVY